MAGKLKPIPHKCTLSQKIYLSIKLPEKEIKERLKVELAVRLYQKGILGFGKARELDGLNKWEFQEVLAKEGISLNYDVEELERDLETLESLD